LVVIAGLSVVALLAGLVDAIAGGGGMLTVPALLATGLPPHLALGTNKGCSTWGTTAATITFARKGRLRFDRAMLGLLAGGAAAAQPTRVDLGANVIWVVTFAWKGTVIWRIALPMAIGNIVGGMLGARIAMKGGDRIVRLTVICVSLALVAKLAHDLLRV